MKLNKATKNQILFEFLRTALAILISIVLIVIILLFVSENPMTAIKNLFLGPFEKLRLIGNIIEMAIPLTFCGLALTLTFRAKQYNLVADGAFFAGAMIACIIGIKFPSPPWVIVVVGLLGGALIGALLGFIPAIIEIKTGAMVLVTSLMLNYVINYTVLYFLINKIRDPRKMILESEPVQSGVTLPRMIPGTRIHAGLFIVIICVILVAIFLYKTKWGYELRMTGSNKAFAHYSGISVNKVILFSQVIGASIAGLGGATELFGMYSSFKWSTSPLYGFDGVIIAALARENPIAVPFAALFLAYIRTGADILNRTGEVPAEIVIIVQSTIIILIAANGFLKKLKQKSLEKQSNLSTNEGKIQGGDIL